MKKSILAFIVLSLFVFTVPVFAAGVKAKDYEVVHRYVMNDGVIMEICTEAKAPEWFKLAAAHASLDSNSSSWQNFSPYKDGKAAKAFIIVNQLECTAELDNNNDFTGLFNSEIKSFLGSPFLDYWTDESSQSRKNRLSYNAIADFSEINDEIKNPDKSETIENDADNLFIVQRIQNSKDEVLEILVNRTAPKWFKVLGANTDLTAIKKEYGDRYSQEGYFEICYTPKKIFCSKDKAYKAEMKDSYISAFSQKGPDFKSYWSNGKKSYVMWKNQESNKSMTSECDGKTLTITLNKVQLTSTDQYNLYFPPTDDSLILKEGDKVACSFELTVSPQKNNASEKVIKSVGTQSVINNKWISLEDYGWYFEEGFDGSTKTFEKTVTIPEERAGTYFLFKLFMSSGSYPSEISHGAAVTISGKFVFTKIE
ncbi:MAG: hypothetical protein IJ688_11795 [Treponema sp.]|nr:hypothetical protein [Treponema sp.]